MALLHKSIESDWLADSWRGWRACWNDRSVDLVCAIQVQHRTISSDYPLVSQPITIRMAISGVSRASKFTFPSDTQHSRCDFRLVIDLLILRTSRCLNRWWNASSWTLLLNELRRFRAAMDRISWNNMSVSALLKEISTEWMATFDNTQCDHWSTSSTCLCDFCTLEKCWLIIVQRWLLCLFLCVLFSISDEDCAAKATRWVLWTITDDTCSSHCIYLQMSRL